MENVATTNDDVVNVNVRDGKKSSFGVELHSKQDTDLCLIRALAITHVALGIDCGI
jgi:hypothetical protein